MSTFEEYLESTSSIKSKEVINESYEVKSYDGQEDVSYDYLTFNDEEVDSHELENIAEFLNLLGERKEILAQWINFLKRNKTLSLNSIKIKCGVNK